MQDHKEPTKKEKVLLVETPIKFQDVLEAHLNDGYQKEGDMVACGEFLCQWVEIKTGCMRVESSRMTLENLMHHLQHENDSLRRHIEMSGNNFRRYSGNKWLNEARERNHVD